MSGEHTPSKMGLYGQTITSASDGCTPFIPSLLLYTAWYVLLLLVLKFLIRPFPLMLDICHVSSIVHSVNEQDAHIHTF